MDIAAWLSNLGLERHKQAFEDNAIDFALLPRLTADDLRDIGITAVGDRRRLLEAIAALQEKSRGRAAKPEPPTALVSRPRDAERRQLTVMFVDLVGSTSLAGRLDPEDMREVLAAYQGCCAEVVGRFEGYVAKLMGDGVLAYFGWPAAHEDDAERAVLAGLEVVAAVAALKPHGDVKLAARAGISTGNVVVGDLIGAGAAQEQAVVGETPNLAARIQSLADAGTVVIGQSTRKLLGAGFKCEDLGARMLAGVKVPVRLWHVLGPSQQASRFDALRGEALVELVGREDEVTLLAWRWDLAKQGKGQVVVLSGEPGIGKSRLLRVLEDQIAGEAHTRLVYQCSPVQMGRAFHPIIGQIEHAGRITAQDSADEKAEKLRGLIERTIRATPEDLAIFGALLSLPGGEGFPELEPDPKQRKARIFAAFLRQFDGLAAQRPVLCIFEDVHWSDPSTMEFLQQLVEWIPTCPVLLLVTCRPEFISPWTGIPHCTLISLSRMSTSETTELVTHVVGGRQLPDEVVRQILLKTNGIPLFVEELTRAVVESGILKPTDGGYILTETLPELAVPATLHDSLMARLDRLSGAREVAQLAAAIGHSPDYRLLSAVAPCDEATLGQALTQLEEAGLLARRGTPPDSSYSFKHALIREAAYGSMLRATRQDYHRRIAAALEQRSPGLARTEAALLAHHYAEGGMMELAIRWFRQAGETAVGVSAYAEAVGNFARSLALLEQLPESPERAREEIAVRLALGAVQLPNLRGSAEVERSYLRVLALCERFGAPQNRFAALWGLWFFHYQQGDIHGSRAYGDQLLPHARELGDSSLLLEAHHVQWAIMSAVGELRLALGHTGEGIARYDGKEHHGLTFIYGGHDPGVCARNIRGVTLCALGYLDQARRQSEAALALAHELAHPNTLAHGYLFALIVGLLIRDVAKVEQLASKLDDLERNGKAPPGYAAAAESFRGWMLAEKGFVVPALSLLRKTWEGWDVWSLPLGACMAAMLGKIGRTTEGLRVVDEGLHAAERGGAHWYDAELYRVRAELRHTSDAGRGLEAEKDLKKAIETARAQDARHFELRAATDLSRYWAEQGQSKLAHDLLAPVLDWFTEGLDTPDVVAARTHLSRMVA